MNYSYMLPRFALRFCLEDLRKTLAQKEPLSVAVRRLSWGNSSIWRGKHLNYPAKNELMEAGVSQHQGQALANICMSLRESLHLEAPQGYRLRMGCPKYQHG